MPPHTESKLASSISTRSSTNWSRTQSRSGLQTAPAPRITRTFPRVLFLRLIQSLIPTTMCFGTVFIRQRTHTDSPLDSFLYRQFRAVHLLDLHCHWPDWAYPHLWNPKRGRLEQEARRENAGAYSFVVVQTGYIVSRRSETSLTYFQCKGSLLRGDMQ
jgi:hypothetical protein